MKTSGRKSTPTQGFIWRALVPSAGSRRSTRRPSIRAETTRPRRLLLGRNGSRPNERLDLLRIQTDLIVALHWRQVQRVTAELLERRTLSGDEIIKIVGIL